MRALFTLILGIALFSSFGQGTFHISDTSNSWTSVSGGYGPFYVVCCISTSNIHFHGDTTLENKTYRKVFESFDSLQTDPELIGLLHEDIPNNKIYYRDLQGNEGMIYDFGVLPGDTLYLDNYYYSSLDNLLICHSIDSIVIGTEYRTRYNFNTYWTDDVVETWIEGIGSSEGILCSGFPGSNIVGGFYDLLCHSSSDSVVYTNPPYYACFMHEYLPKITSEYFDTAFVNTYYHFQIGITDTNAFDSVSWLAWSIPQGFIFDEETGILEGFPGNTGTFNCAVTVLNWGYATDLLNTPLVVVNPTSLSQIDQSGQIFIAPNPCQDHLFVNLPKGLKERCTALIYSFEGKEVFRQMIGPGEDSRIQCGAFSPGIYFIKVMDRSKKVVMAEKVIIL